MVTCLTTLTPTSPQNLFKWRRGIQVPNSVLAALSMATSDQRKALAVQLSPPLVAFMKYCPSGSAVRPDAVLWGAVLWGATLTQ
jgi:hypothetical protein